VVEERLAHQPYSRHRMAVPRARSALQMNGAVG
jgi:hypothetical protein